MPNHPSTPRKTPDLAWWILWLVALGGLVWLALQPDNNRVVRVAELSLALGVWLGLIPLVWRWRALRWGLIAITIVAGGFLAWPARGNVAAAVLREDYLVALRRYEGVKYVWGGENARGIDCSGLIRRGLIDAMFWRGIRSAEPALVRKAIALWWNDCSASALGEEHAGLTARVLQTSSLNALDHALLLPGDLAVTASGIHILAYLGDRRWIEADPAMHQVVILSAPQRESSWFQARMNIVRWSVLR